MILSYSYCLQLIFLWPSWLWIYNYLRNQCLPPLKLCVRILLWWGVFDTTLCDKVCRWLAVCGFRGCSGSQKVGARKITRCHFQMPVLKVRSQFRSQLKFLQGANFFDPKLWMIACSTTSFMLSFMYKWSGFVCTNVNICIVLLFFISISSSKTKRFI